MGTRPEPTAEHGALTLEDQDVVMGRMVGVFRVLVALVDPHEPQRRVT